MNPAADLDTARVHWQAAGLRIAEQPVQDHGARAGCLGARARRGARVATGLQALGALEGPGRSARTCWNDAGRERDGPRTHRLRRAAQGLPAHLDCYNQVHIALDTFPYNGTTTTAELFLMGVPVVAPAVHAR